MGDMRTGRVWAAWAAAVLLLAAASPARALSEQEDKIVARGLDTLYRADFDGSEKIFEEGLKEHPGSPPLSLGCAIAAWWRMESDFAPPGSPGEARFFDALRRAIDDAKRVAEEREDAEAYVCLGAAYGLRGRREAAQKHWIKAYRDGRRAYKYEKRAAKLDPSLYDAYLGIGAFDYYVARLSRFVRLFVFTNTGDKDQGLAELKLATRGRFSAVAAKLLLVGIHWTFEKDPREAWRILEEVHAQYPDSPQIGSMRLIGLFHLRDGEGLAREARSYLRKAETGAPFFRSIDKAAGHYFVGLGEQLLGRYEEAMAQDQTALALLPAGHPTRCLPRLFIGECLDLLGRRREAVAAYKDALKEAPLWGVPRYAKHLIDHPFRAGDNPLPSRNDSLD